jgi:hypothetical protein
LKQRIRSLTISVALARYPNMNRIDQGALLKLEAMLAETKEQLRDREARPEGMDHGE